MNRFRPENNDDAGKARERDRHLRGRAESFARVHARNYNPNRPAKSNRSERPTPVELEATKESFPHRSTRRFDVLPLCGEELNLRGPMFSASDMKRDGARPIYLIVRSLSRRISFTSTVRSDNTEEQLQLPLAAAPPTQSAYTDEFCGYSQNV